MELPEYTPGYGLAGAFYSDPAIYNQDIERVFRRHWLCVGHVSQVANQGDFLRCDIDTESVLITRARDNTLHAMLNVCRHRGAELCAEAAGNTRAFTCAYHAWSYNLDGSLRAARHMPNDFDPTRHGLKKLHLRESAGLIFISFAEAPLDFDRAAETLAATCGAYGWGEAKIAHRATYRVAANWKLAVENYVECYHCAPAHPEYSQTHALQLPPEKIAHLRVTMEQRTGALGLSIPTTNHWHSSATGHEAVDAFRYPLFEGVSSGSKDGGPIAPLMGKFTDYDGAVTAVHVGGTTFIAAYPDHGMVYRFIPTGVQSCEMELIWLIHPDAVAGVDYDFEALTWLWRVTTEADKRIIEQTARGVRSRGYVPGPLAPMEANELRYIGWYLNEVATS